MRVHEIMTDDVACCTPDTPLHDVAQMMDECDCGAIPVVESEQNHHPVGIITDRDIVVRCLSKGRNPLEITVGDCMTSPIDTVPSDADIEDCIRVMERKQLRRVPVVDEQGNCVGIVSQADIALKAPEHETAEVVREISEPAERHAAHVS